MTRIPGKSRTRRKRAIRGCAGGIPLVALVLAGCASALPPEAPARPPPSAATASPADADAPRAAARNHHEIAADADAAYKEGQFRRCGPLYEEAAAAAPGNAGSLHFYNAACCHALAGDEDRAFAALERAIAIDVLSPNALTGDQDLASLRADPRWPALLEKEKQRRDEHVATLHQELYRIYEADQDDRNAGPDGIDWSKVTPRDEARRERVLEILARDEATQSDDYYHAAMIFQHGSSLEDIDQAHRLALRAVELDGGNERAKWLAAATKDRWLMKQDRPQLYGTQYRKADGVWILHPVDPAVTDEERARWNVQPLRQSLRFAAELNRKK